MTYTGIQEALEEYYLIPNTDNMLNSTYVFQLQLHCDHYRDQSHYAICIKRIFNFEFSYQTLPHTAHPKKSFFIPLVCKLFAPPMASVRTITVYLQEYSNDIRIYLVTIKVILDFAVLLWKSCSKVVQESRPIQFSHIIKHYTLGFLSFFFLLLFV